ncbi:MAG: hypothetical protein Ct9H300mP12_17200 [Acidimicrobiales bacterium]|nr:MAG: hypothetical protein Ct9H300mP12_17200 [Acidimicrobiales bacterium]
MRPVTNIDYKELAEADLIFVGTWVDGLILFGHRPGDTGKVRQIPKLWDKKVAAFMTHAVNPGNARTSSGLAGGPWCDGGGGPVTEPPPARG